MYRAGTLFPLESASPGFDDMDTFTEQDKCAMKFAEFIQSMAQPFVHRTNGTSTTEAY